MSVLFVFVSGSVAFRCDIMLQTLCSQAHACSCVCVCVCADIRNDDQAETYIQTKKGNGMPALNISLFMLGQYGEFILSIFRGKYFKLTAQTPRPRDQGHGVIR